MKGDIIMEQNLNEETRTEAPIRRRRRKSKKTFPIPVPAFLTHIGEDVRWYYDVRLWSPLILLLLILALLPGKQPQVEVVETKPEVIIETAPVETEPPEPINPDAEALARLADSVGAGRSDNAKIIIMWVAINRAEDRSNGYGQSLVDEIARPNQWQGYDENTVYTQATYDMAKEVLRVQQTGGLRPLDSDMLWLVLNDNGSVTVRNQFTATANQKWREKTVN